MADQYQFKAAHLAQSCDLSAYEQMESQVTALFQDFQVYSQEVERKINVSSEDLDPESFFDEWAKRVKQVQDVLSKQRKLLKRIPQGQHMETCNYCVGDELIPPLLKWSESLPGLKKFTQYLLSANTLDIRAVVELDEELQLYLSDFEKKIQEYENTASDSSKSEYLLEKLTDLEKLISNIKAVGDKRRQLLNTEEAKYLAAEQQKIVAKELKQRVSAVRRLIEEHQKQQKDSRAVSRSHKSSHVGNPGNQSKPRQSVTDGSNKIANVATSRSSKRQESDKLELENLKAKQEYEQRFREQEMQLQNELEEMRLRKEREEMVMRKRER